MELVWCNASQFSHRPKHLAIHTTTLTSVNSQCILRSSSAIINFAAILRQPLTLVSFLVKSLTLTVVSLSVSEAESGQLLQQRDVA